jgi:hypothetical protein
MVIWIVALGLLLVAAFMIAFYVQGALRRASNVPWAEASQRRRQWNTRVLWALIGVAIVYIGALRILHTLTGVTELDGGVGVALGLYICAHPAANAVNVLFFERDLLNRISEWSVMRWLALNLLVLLVGWMVIYVGITRLVARSG